MLQDVRRWVALFASWSGRAVPTPPRRNWPRLYEWLLADEPDLITRLMQSGDWEAAAILEDAVFLADAEAALSANDRNGWRLLLPSDYPVPLTPRLAAEAPAVLWVREDAAPIRSPGFTIVGSRDASPAELEFARAAGATAASFGYSVISGGARGVDRAAVFGAKSVGGSAWIWLPGGDDGTVGTAVSTYPDSSVFRRVEALQRNRWLYAAAECSLVVASRVHAGGSWQGAMFARRSKIPHLVYIGKQPSPGNAALAGLGSPVVRDISELNEALTLLKNSVGRVQHA